jgi:hypothetical protein
MTTFSRLADVGILGLVLFGNVLTAQEFGRYREFSIGSDVETVSKATATATPDLKVLHQRPALIQELTWRPRYGVRRPTGVDNESVEQVVFSFVDNQLFRIAVEYDRERTAGMTDADMIQAISAVYGPKVALAVSTSRTPSPARDDLGMPLAQWGNAGNTVLLYRLASFAIRFRLVVTGEPLAALARTAVARAVVLDAREAPQREADLVKKNAEESRLAEEKARAENKATFRP